MIKILNYFFFFLKNIYLALINHLYFTGKLINLDNLFYYIIYFKNLKNFYKNTQKNSIYK
jgi:hypothetical protein